MLTGGENLEAGAAFVMDEGDRFDRIIVSDGVRYEKDGDAETVITFFVISRSGGSFDVVNVNRTFSGDDCVSRTVQAKTGVPADRVADEVDNVRIGFAMGVKRATGYKLRWHELDLSEVGDPAEQLRRIKQWGRVAAWTEADTAAWN